ncbi:hypothetical protein BASA81_000191 [Batrachochytrium salamandrivorans]|nr:hypothetical protein BASA81_000191 [Batrachochytrium salamandrivorans]
MWEGPFAKFDNNPKLFLSRSISHICAPGFFFTMGISMTLFSLNRRTRHEWTWRQVFYHYLVRGSVLLLVEYVVNFPNAVPQLVDYWRGREVRSWTDPEASLTPHEILMRSSFGIYEVMTCLGLATIFAPLALPVFFRAQRHHDGNSTWLVLTVGLGAFLLVFLISAAVILYNQDLDDLEGLGGFPHFAAKCGNVLEFGARYLFLPGKLFKSWQMAVYPLFPWLGLTLLGMGFGFEVAQHGTIRHMRWYALVCFVAFAAIRLLAGAWLNFRGLGRGEDMSDVSWMMAFFLQTKYPPDLCYATLTLGVNFLLLELFSTRVVEYVSYPLLVFGRTPLFFYALHFWIIAMFEAIMRVPVHPSGKFNLEYVLFVWMLVLVVAFFACKRYYKFKSTTSPTSLWRVF